MKKVVLLVFATLFLSCCATRRTVEYRDRVVTEYQTKEVHDTLREKTTDSIYVEVKERGDTVFQTKYVERTRWRERIVARVDTLTRDSIVVQEKKVTVEKRVIPKWCYISLAVWAIFFIFALNKLRKWQRIS